MNHRIEMLRLKPCILHYALRYALGRSTYAPRDILEAVILNIDKVHVVDIKLMLKDIVAQESYGADMDERVWDEITVRLKAELDRREE